MPQRTLLYISFKYRCTLCGAILPIGLLSLSSHFPYGGHYSPCFHQLHRSHGRFDFCRQRRWNPNSPCVRLCRRLGKWRNIPGLGKMRVLLKAFSLFLLGLASPHLTSPRSPTYTSYRKFPRTSNGPRSTMSFTRSPSLTNMASSPILIRSNSSQVWYLELEVTHIYTVLSQMQ